MRRRSRRELVGGEGRRMIPAPFVLLVAVCAMSGDYNSPDPDEGTLEWANDEADWDDGSMVCWAGSGWGGVDSVGVSAGYAVWTEGTADPSADLPHASWRVGGRVHALHGTDPCAVARRCDALADGETNPDR